MASLTVTRQPVPGASSGAVFATQPIVTLKDQYGNICTTGPSATADVVATAKAGTGTWTIGGTVTKAAVEGVATFTDLTCTLTSPGNGAVTFTSTATVDSSVFTIPLISAKMLTADTTDNNVDNNIEITFGADAAFEAAVTGVSFKGTPLTVTTDYVVSGGKITLKPSGGNAVLKTPATGDVVITATGYDDSSVSQTINHGSAVTMVLTQNISAPMSNGEPFSRQPVITLKDAYGNICTDDNSTLVTASKKDAGYWMLSGETAVNAFNGIVTFSDLGAINSSYITNALLAFNSGVLPEVTSDSVTLPSIYVPPIDDSSESGPAGEIEIAGDKNSAQDATEGGIKVGILVDGEKQDKTSNATVEIIEDKVVVTVSIDKTAAMEKLKETKETVTIPVKGNLDVFVGQMDGEITKVLEDKSAVVEIKTDTTTYALPASEIHIEKIAEQFGQNVELKDLTVSIKIEKSNADTVQMVEDTANKGGFAIVVPPIEFKVTVSYGDKSIEINKFEAYVERTVAIPDGVDPSKITTGIVVDPDGTPRHVPTRIVVIDGKYYARINSLTNSTYLVIWNPLEFADVKNHWAKIAINDMGSRMVLNGIGAGRFEPDKDITRAEFTAIVVKGLGLKPGTGYNPFIDIKSTDWYCGYIETAYEYGIILGYGNGKFGPNDKLTREQAMIIISRAMNITGLKIDLNNDEIKQILDGFNDSENTSEWAKDSIAKCIKAGIVSGRSNNKIAPRENITRAEVAVMVRRLLQKSKLI